MTLKDLSLHYLNTHLVSRSSYATTKRLLRNTFEPLNDIFVTHLTPLHVLTWHSSLSHTPFQANRALGVLRSMIRWGIRLGLCTNDPTVGIARFRVSSRSRFLTTKEITDLFHVLKTAPSKIRLFVLLVLSTGCRRGEAQTLQWSDLDLAQRRWTKPRTKSGTWHVVPLPHQIIEAFKDYPVRGPWVFPGNSGKPWSLAGIEKAWGRVRHQCHLRDVRIHDLRRTAASHLAIHGENLTTIQAMLDHSSLQATAIYARLNLSALDMALQRNADRFFSSAILPSCSSSETT